MSAKHDFNIKKWEYLIKNYQESGMKLKEWCATNEISRYQYYYWLNKVRGEHYDAAVKQLDITETINNDAIPLKVQTGSFVELNPEMVGLTPKQINHSPLVSNMNAGNLPMAVLKKGGIEIEIMQQATASFILQLLKAMHHA